MKFKYTIETVPKNRYGSWDLFDEKWSGIIGYLVDKVRNGQINLDSVSYTHTYTYTKKESMKSIFF